MISSTSKGHLLSACFIALLSFLPVNGAIADEFAAPAGEVILTVSGNMQAHNVDDTLQLDLDALSAMPQHSITTSTVWTVGTKTFTGVLLKDFIAAVGAGGSAITLTALNDYQVTFPTADVRDDGPLLGYLMDGKPMSVRDKGPVWLVYPYDSNPDYRSELAYSRSIWQLDRIAFNR